jgi:hypothetical protein
MLAPASIQRVENPSTDMQQPLIPWENSPHYSPHYVIPSQQTPGTAPIQRVEHVKSPERQQQFSYETGRELQQLHVVQQQQHHTEQQPQSAPNHDTQSSPVLNELQQGERRDAPLSMPLIGETKVTHSDCNNTTGEVLSLLNALNTQAYRYKNRKFSKAFRSGLRAIVNMKEIKKGHEFAISLLEYVIKQFQFILPDTLSLARAADLLAKNKDIIIQDKALVQHSPVSPAANVARASSGSTASLSCRSTSSLLQQQEQPPISEGLMDLVNEVNSSSPPKLPQDKHHGPQQQQEQQQSQGAGNVLPQKYGASTVTLRQRGLGQSPQNRQQHDQRVRDQRAQQPQVFTQQSSQDANLPFKKKKSSYASQEGGLSQVRLVQTTTDLIPPNVIALSYLRLAFTPHWRTQPLSYYCIIFRKVGSEDHYLLFTDFEFPREVPFPQPDLLVAQIGDQVAISLAASKDGGSRKEFNLRVISYYEEFEGRLLNRDGGKVNVIISANKFNRFNNDYEMQHCLSVFDSVEYSRLKRDFAGKAFLTDHVLGEYKGNDEFRKCFDLNVDVSSFPTIFLIFF